MKISFIFFSVVALLFSSTSVFALDETKIRAARDACMKARENKTESSITEYVCPSGDVWKESQRPITKETICGSIAIQLTFEEIDKDAEKWMKKLQDTRNPNIISWTDEIYKKVRTTDSVGT